MDDTRNNTFNRSNLALLHRNNRDISVQSFSFYMTLIPNMQE